MRGICRLSLVLLRLAADSRAGCWLLLDANVLLVGLFVPDELG